MPFVLSCRWWLAHRLSSFWRLWRSQIGLWTFASADLAIMVALEPTEEELAAIVDFTSAADWAGLRGEAGVASSPRGALLALIGSPSDGSVSARVIGNITEPDWNALLAEWKPGQPATAPSAIEFSLAKLVGMACRLKVRTQVSQKQAAATTQLQQQLQETQATPDEVAGAAAAFLEGHGVLPQACERFLSLPPHLQSAVMARGTLAGARDATAVLLWRCSQVAPTDNMFVRSRSRSRDRALQQQQQQQPQPEQPQPEQCAVVVAADLDLAREQLQARLDVRPAGAAPTYVAQRPSFGAYRVQTLGRPGEAQKNPKVLLDGKMVPVKEVEVEIFLSLRAEAPRSLNAAGVVYHLEVAKEHLDGRKASCVELKHSSHFHKIGYITKKDWLIRGYHVAEPYCEAEHLKRAVAESYCHRLRGKSGHFWQRIIGPLTRREDKEAFVVEARLCTAQEAERAEKAVGQFLLAAQVGSFLPLTRDEWGPPDELHNSYWHFAGPEKRIFSQILR